MSPVLHTVRRNGKECIFCPFRRKWVAFTPEEEVRQSFLWRLIYFYDYPASLMAVEVQLPSGQRADAVVYNRQLKPVMLIEFKAPSVRLTQQTLDQIAVYNRMLHVPLLVLHNRKQTIVAQVSEQDIQFLPDIPKNGNRSQSE